MDMSPAFRKAWSTHAGQAVICYDPFHVVKIPATVNRLIDRDNTKIPRMQYPTNRGTPLASPMPAGFVAWIWGCL